MIDPGGARDFEGRHTFHSTLRGTNGTGLALVARLVLR